MKRERGSLYESMTTDVSPKGHADENMLSTKQARETNSDV